MCKPMRSALKKRRIQLSLTQEDIAKICGVTRSTVSSWEVGRNEPPLKTIIKLKKLFKTTDDSIFLNQKDTNRTD